MNAIGLGEPKELSRPIAFKEVFETEVEAINARRAKLVALRGKNGEEAVGEAPAQRDGAEQDDAPYGMRQMAVRATGKQDERGREMVVPKKDHGLVGLALSGGGIRSASFCLGVLQGLGSLTKADEPSVIEHVDFLSTVSGGGYVGISLVSGLMQKKGAFPFESKLDEQETPEVKHLRDHSNFLAPNGAIDYVTHAVVLLRGLLVNFTLVLAVLLWLALVTIASNPTVADLKRAGVFGQELEGEGGGTFYFTLRLAVIFIVIELIYAVALSIFDPKWGLRQRETGGKLLGWALIGLVAAAICEAQSYVLSGMFAAAAAPGKSLPASALGAASTLAALLRWLGDHLATLSAVLLPAVAGIMTFAQKLIKVAKATVGADTWSGFIKHWSSRLALYAAALLVPLLLWVGYLYLSFWGIKDTLRPAMFAHAPGWLRAGAQIIDAALGPAWQAIVPSAWSNGIPALYLVAAVLLSLFCLLIGPNANSLHRLYRDRLSRAFLFRKDELVAELGQGDPDPDASTKEPEPDRWTFTSLGKRKVDGKWPDHVRFAPYLLVNTALNLHGSKYLNRRGRNADFFLFSPLHTGSEATDYVDTATLERKDDMTLGTAMAISGAAASSNVGANSVGPLSFSLSLLNIRLGYWMRNPCRLADLEGWRRAVANIGPVYFALEAFSRLKEKTLNVYLTDGGHIDNLGLYELLKRRCKVILVVDGEADQGMSFASFIRLQRYARIDLGVRIHLPWQEISRVTKGITPAAPRGAAKSLAECCGPHVAIGRVEYDKDDTGVLVYVKASLTGDENDYVMDYKRRNPQFPHETTLDQFFSEEQFEVYRALGFHATRGFFTGRDRGALPDPHELDFKVDEAVEALELLGVPSACVINIIKHMPTAPPTAAAQPPTPPVQPGAAEPTRRGRRPVTV